MFQVSYITISNELCADNMQGYNLVALVLNVESGRVLTGIV